MATGVEVTVGDGVRVGVGVPVLVELGEGVWVGLRLQVGDTVKDRVMLAEGVRVGDTEKVGVAVLMVRCSKDQQKRNAFSSRAWKLSV